MLTSYLNNIDGNSIGPEGAKAIASALREMKFLTYLVISNNLHTALLSLGNNDIGQEGAKAIAPALSELKSLSKLFMS